MAKKKTQRHQGLGLTDERHVRSSTGALERASKTLKNAHRRTSCPSMLDALVEATEEYGVAAAHHASTDADSWATSPLRDRFGDVGLRLKDLRERIKESCFRPTPVRWR